MSAIRSSQWKREDNQDFVAAKENVSGERGSHREAKGREDVETAAGLPMRGSSLTSRRARLQRCQRPKSGYRRGRGQDRGDIRVTQ